MTLNIVCVWVVSFQIPCTVFNRQESILNVGAQRRIQVFFKDVLVIESRPVSRPILKVANPNLVTIRQ